MPRRVAHIHSDELIQAADCLPANEGRASLVHSLCDSYHLLHSSHDNAELSAEDQNSRARIAEPVRATREQLTRFHDEGFIDAILGREKNLDSADNSDTGSSDDEEEEPAPRSFGLAPHPAYHPGSRSSAPPPRKRQKDDTASSVGLQDDCPVFPDLPDYVQLVAGASIAAARELRDGRAEVAINWTGGRHHAKRAEAAGFCYVADAVLAIMELRTPPRNAASSICNSESSPPLPPPAPLEKVSRVLYLDLDLHHGDGVESAFFSSPHVLTLSMHLFAPLFFPSTGALDSTGPKGARASAAGHALNLALEPGLAEETFRRVWESCIEKVAKTYDADAIVLQLGVDGLAGDPCKEWNLSLADLGFALERVLAWKKRTLLLGGGGYNSANAARAWTYLTSIALGRPLDLDAPIPADLPTTTYEEFAPSFTLDVPAGHISDRNTEETLSRVEAAFETYAARLAARRTSST
ncbi:hypothetical protein JCM10908_006065 [Rhodotorula pacifica]|uniref:uncharacterized protein n=1 Tax=Rhodotorula pacifica TaxID=1495444 RepID=UPI00318012EE